MPAPPPFAAAAAARPADLMGEGCQNGDRAAFRRLFETYRTRVHSLARHLLGGDAAAKDVTQQVFLQVWRHMDRLPVDSDFFPWIYRVVVNACINERRRLGRFADREPEEGDRPLGAVQEQAVLARQVEAALARLSDKLRVPLVLRHVEGLSYDEIGQVLGCSMGTVASRLSRGHEALAALLARKGTEAR